MPIGPMPDSKITPSHETIDQIEVERFSAIASEWWDPHGRFRPLHQLTPTRISYIRDQLCHQFKRDKQNIQCLRGLDIADIGCGGGLVAEPLARLGGHVTAIDPSEETIAAARNHAEGENLDINYRQVPIEGLVGEGARFDALLCLEVIEHLPNVAAFLDLCFEIIRPGGILILSTINRTAKSFALAIVAAEYILRWLPAGTHNWKQFVKPDELKRALTKTGFVEFDLRGMIYNPISGEWHLSSDMDVNYFLTATRPASE
jgi:2-polyprenyl-6-hydroxyphenyl methylase/3-demethylubiquinone-9 3-methyltransferase